MRPLVACLTSRVVPGGVDCETSDLTGTGLGRRRPVGISHRDQGRVGEVPTEKKHRIETPTELEIVGVR